MKCNCSLGVFVSGKQLSDSAHFPIMPEQPSSTRLCSKNGCRMPLPPKYSRRMCPTHLAQDAARNKEKRALKKRVREDSDDADTHTNAHRSPLKTTNHDLSTGECAESRCDSPPPLKRPKVRVPCHSGVPFNALLLHS